LSVAAKLYLGVDGGGTGCRARIEDAAGNVLGQGVAGPASTRFGVERSWAAISAAADQAIAEAGLDAAAVGAVAAGLGIAGVGRGAARAALEAMQHPFARLTLVSDGLAACLGAHGGKDGGIVITGTGSIGLARVDGKEMRVGGYGFPISDEGSGADIGLKAIRLALRAFDGCEQKTPLLRAVMARFGDDPFAVVAWMDRATATDYAKLALLVIRHADNGDPAGRRIMQASAAAVDDLARALGERSVPRIALLGGLASSMEPWLAPDVRRRLAPPLADAESGAIIAARDAAP
jgi:glucosamine kinase